ncbi:MAG: choice-of-anchor tandem repeat GloVer-containing protein [Terriglobales bacterium]
MSLTKFTQSSLLLVAGLAALIATRPAQAQTETILYTFCPSGFGCADGAIPNSPLTSDGKGNLYGATIIGGDAGQLCGCGTVFELSPNGSGGWNETVLYSFAGEAGGGAWPTGPLMFDSAGNLYGTALIDGTNGNGVVFELSPGSAGASWTETILYSFAGGTDGFFPTSGVIMDPAGNLYGTTLDGGSAGNGTVFELSPSGGGWAKQTIYNVDTSGYAGLTMDASGNIFGVSQSSVFELSPNGNGGWNPIVIHTFTSNKRGLKLATAPNGTLVFDKAGNLYGTRTGGGANNNGVVFELSPGKNGKWTEKSLYAFSGTDGDGAHPYAGIVFDAAGNIYGTTFGGGTYKDGTVFELVAPVGKGSYQEKVLWSFNGTDGEEPDYGLIVDSSGNLYGTTPYGDGNPNGACYEQGCGVAFEITP